MRKPFGLIVPGEVDEVLHQVGSDIHGCCLIVEVPAPGNGISRMLKRQFGIAGTKFGVSEFVDRVGRIRLRSQRLVDAQSISDVTASRHEIAAFGGSEAVTVKLWRDAGVRVLPGRYIARDQVDGHNPGADYIRVAMVQDNATTAEALHRLVAVLG